MISSMFYVTTLKYFIGVLMVNPTSQEIVNLHQAVQDLNLSYIYIYIYTHTHTRMVLYKPFSIS